MQERMKVPALEDAVVNAVLSLGSNGRGKGGVGGRMDAMASKHPKRFAPLLEMALRLKKSARPNEDCLWCGGKPIASRAQVVAELEELGLPETLLDYLPRVSADELSRLDDGPLSSATDFPDAIIAAARRHGSNGRGKDGVEGYIRMLARIGCRTFDRWVIRAMVEQVKGRSRAHELSPESIEEVKAELREQGVDLDAMLHAAYEAKYGSGGRELWPDEIEDPWGVRKAASSQNTEDLKSEHRRATCTCAIPKSGGRFLRTSRRKPKRQNLRSSGSSSSSAGTSSLSWATRRTMNPAKRRASSQSPRAKGARPTRWPTITSPRPRIGTCTSRW
jgi:hypothetical protein